MKRNGILFGLFLLETASVSAVNFADRDRLATSARTTPDLLQEPAYSGIGSVTITEGNAQFRGTGVLVANDWVLTVAHNWDANAVTDLSFNWNGQSYAANPFAWQQHPG